MKLDIKKLDKIISILKEIKSEIKPKKKLEFEPRNFRINSDGWKKITVDNDKYLINPEEDVWEILGGEFDGKQLFTWEAAMRETKKAGKRIPTDEEFDELLKSKKDMPNLVFPGNRHYTGYFHYRSSTAAFWSSSVSGGDAWRRYLYSSESCVYRYTSDQAHGFSVRCLKD